MSFTADKSSVYAILSAREIMIFYDMTEIDSHTELKYDSGIYGNYGDAR